jgi:hypothetical protein
MPEAMIATSMSAKAAATPTRSGAYAAAPDSLSIELMQCRVATSGATGRVCPTSLNVSSASLGRRSAPLPL